MHANYLRISLVYKVINTVDPNEKKNKSSVLVNDAIRFAFSTTW